MQILHIFTTRDVSAMLDPNRKAAIITGGGAGIGQAIRLARCRVGAGTTACDIQARSFQETSGAKI